jgi:hypothetical protein
VAAPVRQDAQGVVYTRPRTSNVTMGCALFFVALALWLAIKLIAHAVG